MLQINFGRESGGILGLGKSHENDCRSLEIMDVMVRQGNSILEFYPFLESFN